MKTTFIKTTYENIVWWAGVITVGIILGITLQIARAWVEPTEAPPAGNLGAPINTSDTGQYKLGNLIINTNGTWENGLIVANGDVGIGTLTPAEGLTLHVEGGVGANGFYNQDGKGLLWCKGNCPSPTEF